MKKLKEQFWPEDKALIIYLVAISTTLMIFHKEVDRWWVYVVIHSIAVVLLITWVRFASKSQRPPVRFLRYWYIPILYTFLYEEIDAFVLGLHGRYLDHLIYRFELALFGVHPSVWMEQFATPLVTEIMKIAYHSYYWLIPVLGFSLYLKRDFIPFRRMVFSVTVAFFISYFGFVLFPIEGPRYALAHLYEGPLTGYGITALQDLIMKYGSLHGGCMPSSHVAVALVVLMLAWTYRRRIAMVMTPLVTGLCISTVYNRYHYVSDVVMGLVVGVAAFYWGKLVYPDAFPVLEEKEQEEQRFSVSLGS